MRKKTKLLPLMLAVLLTAGICGFAPAQSQASPREISSLEKSSYERTLSGTSRPKSESLAKVLNETRSESANPEPQETPSSGSSNHSTVRERIERIRKAQKAAQESSKAAQESSKASQESSKTSQESSKASQESGKTSQKSSKTSQESSKASQESSKASQEGKKSGASSKSTSKKKDTGSGKASSSSESSSASSETKAEEKLQVGPDIQAIAQLADLQAGVEIYNHKCVVDVDEGENPYDVIWDYGKLYDAFVKEVDWDLLFDGDYYIKTFPGLAHLYHKDKALLLRHFQTVGIHEGRQGCEGFNVAAYQKNCDAKVREAFGDHYECYYFYYAMNQKTQKGIGTTGSKKKQLTTKLTHMQQEELDKINEYRAEVGTAPVEYDAELSALACYRAYIDALEDWDAHDWLHAPEKQDEIDRMMDMIEAYNWSENTVHGYQRTKDYALRQGPAGAWYINYRYSEDHYKAMINEKHHYLGSANCYVSDYKKENPKHPYATAVYIHYDVFVPELITPVHK